jgi:hypothetical protein
MKTMIYGAILFSMGLACKSRDRDFGGSNPKTNTQPAQPAPPAPPPGSPTSGATVSCDGKEVSLSCVDKTFKVCIVAANFAETFSVTECPPLDFEDNCKGDALVLTYKGATKTAKMPSADQCTDVRWKWADEWNAIPRADEGW